MYLKWFLSNFQVIHKSSSYQYFKIHKKVNNNLYNGKPGTIFLILIFYIGICSHIWKLLKIHQLNIIKKSKGKNSKELGKDINIFLKKKKQKYGFKQYKNLPEDEKQI